MNWADGGRIGDWGKEFGEEEEDEEDVSEYVRPLKVWLNIVSYDGRFGMYRSIKKDML
jgi:hypothetical protein